MANSRFQNQVNITQAGMPQYLAGDMIGNKNLWNPSQSAIVNVSSTAGQAVGSFTWYMSTGVCTPLKADSPSGQLLGFVARTQDTTWANSDVNQGWSMTVTQGYQLQYFATGAFGAVVPSLNNSGAGPIVYGDLVIINNLTGALASQTSTTIPSGYTQCITSGQAWKVIDLSTVADAEGNTIANLCAISNIQASI